MSGREPGVGPSARVSRWARAPLLHFFVIGSVAFAIAGGIDGLAISQPAVAAKERIDISTERVAALRRAQLGQTGAWPTQAETALIIDAEVDDEILFREALASGRHERDAIVARRLVRNMRFLGIRPEASEAELLREAFALGMHRSDLVVRRILVQRMKLDAQALAREQETTDDALREYLARNAESFRTSPLLDVSHVYLARRSSGAGLEQRAVEPEQRAAALLHELRSEHVSPSRAAELGDPFLLPSHLSANSIVELDGDFGGHFGTAAWQLESGRWEGPIASGYGLHLVWVHEKNDAREPSLDELREKVRTALLVERGEAELARRLARLRPLYDVVVAADAERLALREHAPESAR